MDKERFDRAIESTRQDKRQSKGIGVLGEKSLHAVVKRYMEPCPENHELKIDPYIADIVSEGGIIEIQTRSFEKLRGKLEAFLSAARVTVVYPIPHIRRISWIDPSTGETSGKRKSPKTGSFYDAFYELYKIRGLLAHPNLKILLLLVDVDDYRSLNGWGRDKKRGSSRLERIPTGLAGELAVGNGASGWDSLIPENLPEEFTSADYKIAAGLSLRDAQTALNVLYHVGAVVKVGSKGRMKLYQRAKFKEKEES